MHNIYFRPEILHSPTLSKPYSLEVMERENATFETRVLEGKPEPEIKWFCGSQRLVQSDKVELERDDDTYRVTLRDCRLDQTGPIKVTATNKAGEYSQTATLTVKGDPLVKIIP